MAQPRRCVCATHGHCFDGLASAALFSELLSSIKPETQFEYTACGYGSGPPKPPEFDGQDNAILDYRYMVDDRLSFYFDHHPTAFSGAHEQAHYESKQSVSPSRFIADASFTSCADLIAHAAQKHFDLNLDAHAELIDWAHKIDGAEFDTVEEATDRSSTEMRLAGVVAQFGDSAFLAEAIPVLRREGLYALCQSKMVRKFYRRLAPGFRKYEERVVTRGVLKGEVAYVDLTEAPVTVISKFAQYKAFPHATYSVVLARMSRSLRLSVGFNPWCGQSCDAHIGRICAVYGGGGHRVVGGISLAGNQLDKAKSIASEVVHLLQGEKRLQMGLEE